MIVFFPWAYDFPATFEQIAHLGITTLSEFLKISGPNFWKPIFKFTYIPMNMIYLIRTILRLVDMGVW